MGFSIIAIIYIAKVACTKMSMHNIFNYYGTDPNERTEVAHMFAERANERGKYGKTNARDDSSILAGDLTNVERNFVARISAKDARYAEIQGNYSCLTA